MSSEEMRIELESFVNQGLQEGWGGWPPKSNTEKTGGGRPKAVGISPVSGVVRFDLCNDYRSAGVYRACSAGRFG